MAKKDLITIKDLSVNEIYAIFKQAKIFKKKPFCENKTLRSKSIALVFQKPSNRTRVSFEVGMFDLGGHAVYLGPDELKLGVRESVKDVAKVLNRYVDGIVARTFSHDDVIKMAQFCTVPVINGLTDLLHPCQALSDIFTIEEKFGRSKVKISFVGDGNNVLHSLLLGASMLGKDIHVATPEGYGPKQEIIEEARKLAKKSGSSVEIGTDPKGCAKDADVLYTDVWVSMGQEKERAERINTFKDFQVNEALVSLAKKKVAVMHCLPAHRGEEITDAVMDSEKAIVYDQAENRLHVQKAILLKLLS